MAKSNTIVTLKLADLDEVKAMAHDIKESLHCLLWILIQYGYSGGNISEGDVLMDHMFMSAGEHAADLLQRYGLVEMNGSQLLITAKGIELMGLVRCECE